ncbi:MAG: 2-amino-4-hydroxy-6-hydroxymethyldihydropteridine diphosphokinase [Woeseiaceae bacterium]|nr:2-amino-4-hydroxy-6-hydroxymethyldihydropteridine diphosphokinase [Woeseiaceae bacterium]
MAGIYLSLGSNDSPDVNLAIAIRELEARYGELKRSAVYQGAAVGFDGADFLNLVVSLQSNQTPLDICHEIELIHNVAGRVREDNKWGSRSLDIDLLLYDDLVRDERPVRVPRDDILRYSFVLRPIAELAPNLVHPVTGNTVLEHWLNFDDKNQPLERVNVNW